MEYFEKNKRKCVIAAVLVLMAIISFFVIGKVATDPNSFTGTIKDLDEKSETVMALTGGAAAASAAISLLPGDAGTPIADKLVDMSGYFMIILAAIMLEKWLITVTGMLAFRIIIPIALIGLAVIQFVPRQALKEMFIKMICVSLVLFMAVPASVVLSNMIDDSYKTSIQETIKNADEKSKDVQEKADGESDQNALEKIFNSIKGGVTEQVENFKNVLSDFVEAAAVLIVTSCVIPLAVMMFFIWLIKMVAGVNFTVPDVSLSEKIKGLKALKEE